MSPTLRPRPLVHTGSLRCPVWLSCGRRRRLRGDVDVTRATEGVPERGWATQSVTLADFRSGPGSAEKA